MDNQSAPVHQLNRPLLRKDGSHSFDVEPLDFLEQIRADRGGLGLSYLCRFCRSQCPWGKSCGPLTNRPHNFLRDVSESFARRYSQTISEGRGPSRDLRPGDVVPNRQDDFHTIDFSGNQSIEFSLGPLFLEKLTTENDDTETGAR